MNSRFLKIVILGFSALFLSAQAFACALAPKDRDICFENPLDQAYKFSTDNPLDQGGRYPIGNPMDQ